MMKALRISLIASSAFLTAGTPCVAANDAATIPPKEQVKINDVNTVEKNTYPFGQPLIKEDTAKSIWNATLPGRGVTIKSQWANQPIFTVEATGEGKFEGVASLNSISKSSAGDLTPPVFTALIYVYEPKAVHLDTSNPGSIITTLIDDTAAQARQIGLTVNVDKLAGKSDKSNGVVEDTRRKSIFSEKVQTPKAEAVDEKNQDEDQPVEMETTEQVIRKQYSRILIGKDFVVLGLVMGGAEISEENAQLFLDSIAIQPAQLPKPASK